MIKDDNNVHSPEQEGLCEQEALEACHKQIAYHEERYKRLAADFDNFRRRADREKARVGWEARAKVLRGALDLVDTIDRAAGALHGKKTNGADLESLQELLLGVELLQKASVRFLEQQGVRAINEVEQFDPSVHEAVVYTHSPHRPGGAIIEVFEKGYTLDGELLRPARVSVNDATATPAQGIE